MGLEDRVKNPTDGFRLKTSAGLAFSLHGIVFLVGSLSLATQAEYGMASAVPRGGNPHPVSAVQEAVDFDDFPSDDAPVKKRKVPTPVPTPEPPQTAGGAGFGGAYEVPSYFRNPPPPYPEEARRLKQEGSVLLRANVDSEGKVSSVILRKSSGFNLLDEAALKTVESWKFKPARLAGIAVSTEVDIPVRFQLENRGGGHD